MTNLMNLDKIIKFMLLPVIILNIFPRSINNLFFSYSNVKETL